MFGPEEEVPRPDLHNGGWLKGRGQGEQGQLWQYQGAISGPALLPVQELQATLNIHGLEEPRRNILQLNWDRETHGKR